ncbi:MAG: PilZ domain-containing protein [Desulfarculaceae bacterium]|jgi:hypothetical protein
MREERRKHTRYTPSEKAYAVFRPGFETMGRVMDISQGGVSFEYLSSIDQNGAKASMDLFLMDTDFRLTQVPCQVAYDHLISQGRTTGKGMALRRCAVMFKDLDEYQQRQLGFFLRNYVGGEA